MSQEKNGIFIGLAFVGGVLAWRSVYAWAEQHLTDKQAAVGAVTCLAIANMHDWNFD